MRFGPSTLLLALCSVPALAAADAATPPAPPPYSMPFQLRPAGVASAVRSDTSFASFEPDGAAVVSLLTGSVEVVKGVAPFLRVGVASNQPPDGPSQVAALNPIAGLGWAYALSPNLKLAGVVGLALPVGAGGGDHPAQSTRAALGAGVLARASMDNALFGVNYGTAFTGVDLAFVAGGFTVQGEVTLFEAGRLRGGEVDADTNRTNLTMGLYAGWFVAPIVSLGCELRAQRWLVAESILDDGKGANDENVSVAIGARFHLKLSDTAWARPGLAWIQGIDDPLAEKVADVIQIDIPVSF